MKKWFSATAFVAMLVIFCNTSSAQVITRSLTWNLTGTQSWPTVGAGNTWDNKANWVITGTSTAPATNVTNGDKLIFPNVAGLRINVTANLSIALSNFAIETQGAARFNLNTGVDFVLSSSSAAFSMNKATAGNGLTLARRQGAANTTQLIINGVVKAMNTSTAAITPPGTPPLSLQALGSSTTAASVTGYNGFILGVLPISLGDFSVRLTGSQKAGLSWTTLQEINTDHFDIQRSTDGISWLTVATIKAAGNSSDPVNYGFTDLSAQAGSNYYRLFIVDADGKTGYSTTKMIRISASGKISIYPNPTANILNVSLSQVRRSEWHLVITNSNGQVVLHNRYGVNTSVVSVPVDRYANGNYYVQIIEGDNRQTNKVAVIHP